MFLAPPFMNKHVIVLSIEPGNTTCLYAPVICNHGPPRPGTLKKLAGLYPGCNGDVRMNVALHSGGNTV